MIFNFDVSGLEVVCAAYLSRDETLIKELEEGADIHTANQQMLGLPEGKEGRRVAKVFKFRLLYGGSVFHNDPDFMGVSTSRKYWDKMIQKYYEKYKGISKWHTEIVREVGRTGILINPTGRSFKFEMRKNYKGELELPVTQIKNYPVQSLGADIVSIIRVDFYKRFKNANIPGVLVNTVHDSIVLDLDTNGKEWVIDEVRVLFNNVLSDFPNNFQRLFGVAFDLEIKGEMEIGQNMYDMEKI